jgi:hypothetical protein
MVPILSRIAWTCNVGAVMAHMVVDAMYARTGELKLVSAMVSVQPGRNAKVYRTCT